MSSDRESAESLKARGNALRAAGDLEGAIASYRRSLEAAPGYAPSLYNLGMALHEAGSFEDAEQCFRRVLTLAPRDPDALFHLGALLQRRQRLDEAADAYRQALALRPDDFELRMRLGDVLLAARTPVALAEAERCLTEAAALQPESVAAHFNLGIALRWQGRLEPAVASLRRAFDLQPRMQACLAALLSATQHACDWSRFDELCELRRSRARPVADAAEPPADPFGLLSIPATLDEQLAAATDYSGWIAAQAAAEARRKGLLPPPALPRASRDGQRARLRVGYLSGDFHEHVTAHAMAEVFELHDRARVETLAYSYGPDDESPVRSRLKRAFDRFSDVSGLSDAAAAAAIRSDRVDVLVDLKGYTEGARPGIVALRPARVQASYLGYPASMGAEFIDYIVTDRFVLPAEHAAFYRERPAWLPHSYYPSDGRRPLPDAARRGEAGLPGEGFVFCCFNQAYKILPEAFATWMRLLGSVPGSVLWLLEINAAASANLRREARQRGVDPGRLVFAPKSDPPTYLSRLRAADLFLDTWPYNAHTTASDALWVGVPMVTRTGDTLPSRVAGSQLRALGLEELVTESTAAYEALALRLARNPAALAAVREKLWQNRRSAALFDTPRLVRHLEVLYEEMRRVHAAGGAPRPIEIAS